MATATSSLPDLGQELNQAGRLAWSELWYRIVRLLDRLAWASEFGGRDELVLDELVIDLTQPQNLQGAQVKGTPQYALYNVAQHATGVLPGTSDAQAMGDGYLKVMSGGDVYVAFMRYPNNQLGSWRRLAVGETLDIHGDAITHVGLRPADTSTTPMVQVVLR